MKAEAEELERERSDKILEYESFLNNNLKTSLHRVYTDRQRVYEEIGMYNQVRETVSKLELLGDDGLQTRVNLGCEFYVRAKVKNPSRMLVHAGLGFFIESTPDEAVKIALSRETLLRERADRLTTEASDLQLRIDTVNDLLVQLMQLEHS